jgi:glycerophosphoryl diester phosphodiesterase
MRPLLLGHRGSRCSRTTSENTFAAFDLALEHECDGFEFDVRLTSDGVAVVCHDARFRRISISRGAASRVPELPTLEAVLDRYSARAFLDIELKVAGLEPQVHQLLSRYPPKKGVVVSSFLPKVLLELRRIDASIRLGLICGNRRQLRRWRELPIDYVIAQHTLISWRLIREAHEAEKKVFVWTVNRPAAMLRFANWGADGLITDRTDLVALTFDSAC